MKVLGFWFKAILLLSLILVSECALAQEDSVVQQQEIFIDPVLPPEYPGGSEALARFIAKNLRYPGQAPEVLQSRVFVEVYIDKQGKATDFRIVKGIDAAFDEEALRVIKLLDDWKPALWDGKPVEYRLLLPIRFEPR